MTKKTHNDSRSEKLFIGIAVSAVTTLVLYGLYTYAKSRTRTTSSSPSADSSSQDVEEVGGGVESQSESESVKKGDVVAGDGGGCCGGEGSAVVANNTGNKTNDDDNTNSNTSSTNLFTNVCTRHLYGGAISMLYPKTFDDVSQWRQVPDHQEVYADPSTDTSIIVEINQHQQHIDNDVIAKYFWDELVEDSNACGQQLISGPHFINAKKMKTLPNDAHVSYIVGTQQVSKYRDTDENANTVQIYMCIIRVPSKTSDIGIIMNTPVKIHANSSTQSETVCVSEEERKHFEQFFISAIESFAINDFGLFI